MHHADLGNGMARAGATPSKSELFLWVEIGLLAVAMHWVVWPVVAPDMTDYLLPWYGHIVEHGPLGAFRTPFSNYTPTYLYLLALGSLLNDWVLPIDVIKAISVLGTAFMASGVYRLVASAGGANPRLAAALTFILPASVLNAPYLGQCDAFWTGASLFAVAAAVDRKIIPMLVWAGVAVSFKAQAVFLAPFLLALLLKERVNLAAWLIPPLVYAAMMAPAWLLGWPALDLLLVYARQSIELEGAGNAANLWTVSGALYPEITRALYPFGFIAAVVAVITLVASLRKRMGDKEALILAAALSALMVPWLLPKMHERYFMLADMLTFAWAMAMRSRSAIAVTVGVQGASVSAYIAYTTGNLYLVAFGALVAGASLIALIALCRARGRFPREPFAIGALDFGPARAVVPNV